MKRCLDVVVGGAATAASLDLGLDLHGDLQREGLKRRGNERRVKRCLDVVAGAAAAAGLDLGLDLHGDLQSRRLMEKGNEVRNGQRLDVVVVGAAATASLNLGLDLHLRSPETNVSRRGMRRMRDSPSPARTPVKKTWMSAPRHTQRIEYEGARPSQRQATLQREDHASARRSTRSARSPPGTGSGRRSLVRSVSGSDSCSMRLITIEAASQLIRIAAARSSTSRRYG